MPKPFFEPLTKVLDSKTKKTVSDYIATMISHVKNNCLSDRKGVVLHRQNPKTKKIRCCRGTPSCENDNLYIDTLTGKSLGVGRADRLLSTYFEVSNDRKKSRRNGEELAECLFTHQTERFGMVNSLHMSAGYKEEDLPFPICQPALPDDLQGTDIGFDSSEDLAKEMEEMEASHAFIKDRDEVVVANELQDDDEPEDSIADQSLNDTVDLEAIESRLDHLVPEI